jgi:hypothetical protein
MIALILSANLGVPVVAAIPVVETSTTELAVSVEEYRVFNVTVVKTDVYKAGIHYVAFNASCKIGNSVVRLEAPPYPISILYTTSPLAAIAYSIPPDYKYNWDGIEFVKAPGPPDLYIKYDHPNYYDKYNIGVNDDKSLQGDSKIHIHIAKYHIEDAKSENDLGAIIFSAVQFILALLAVPLVGWVSAAVAAVVIAALWLLNRTITYFLNDILQDERGGGWMWAWGFSGWFIIRWFWVSFGAWRDWGWFVCFLTHGGGGGLWHLMR